MGRLPDCVTRLPTKRYAQGETLISEGDTRGMLFFLLSGEVSIQKGDKEIARIGDRGAVFGEMAALLGNPASASVVATGPVEAHTSDNAEAFIDANPEIAIQLARTLAQRLFHATAYLADIKAQFADRSDHLGMVDEVLDELMQQQRRDKGQTVEAVDDPRL